MVPKNLERRDEASGNLVGARDVTLPNFVELQKVAESAHKLAAAWPTKQRDPGFAALLPRAKPLMTDMQSVQTTMGCPALHAWRALAAARSPPVATV